MLKRSIRLVLIAVVMLSLASFAPSLSVHAGGGRCHLWVTTADELINAIVAANNDRCDTVINMTYGDYILTKRYQYHALGLPPIVDVAISGTLTINGNHSTISRESAQFFGIFRVEPGANVTLNRLTIQHGSYTNGTGIDNSGTLTLNTVMLTHNLSVWGGAIYNSAQGTVTMNNSNISDNEATGQGGGIYNVGTLTLNSTFVSNNRAADAGGGIYSKNRLVFGNLSSTYISSNYAPSYPNIYMP